MAEAQLEQSQVRKFAAVYAEALLTFLDSGEEQWLTWDGHSHRFDFVSVERDAEDPSQLIVLTVTEHWARQIGEIDEITDPEHDHFDAEALRQAVEHQLTEEGVGERILKGYLQQLQKLADQLEADLDTDPDPPPDED
jgi:hypothetical protein